ncbi:MAG: hypothetical protein JSW34_08245 [Candidatus Zixiibacteriota bacterium]|nr:MAG: hypothetical protein JSW34_08245 [candidate division Zixibacteria bacterium]
MKKLYVSALVILLSLAITLGVAAKNKPTVMQQCIITTYITEEGCWSEWCCRNVIELANGTIKYSQPRCTIYPFECP